MRPTRLFWALTVTAVSLVAFAWAIRGESITVPPLPGLAGFPEAPPSAALLPLTFTPVIK